jgi:hypothetical protein
MKLYSAQSKTVSFSRERERESKLSSRFFTVNKKSLIACLLAFCFAFFCLTSSDHRINASSSQMNPTPIIEILFEPLNALLLHQDGILRIPFIAGLVSNQIPPTATFSTIEIYAINDDSEDYISSYTVNEPLVTCWMDSYRDADDNLKQVQKVEADCVFENNEYVLSYTNTLKEAIGMGPNGIHEHNDNASLNKIYDSIEDEKQVVLDVLDLFDSFEAGDQEVIVLKGVFSLPGQTLMIEREVTINMTVGFLDIRSGIPAIVGDMDDRFQTLGFYKGDGHIHSKWSDGDSEIEHLVTDSEDKKMLTIAHQRRVRQLMDWLIFTEHACCMVFGQEGKSSLLGDGCGHGCNQLTGFRDRCAEAQLMERSEGKGHFLVIPAVEIGVITDFSTCNFPYTATFDKETTSHVLHYFGPHINEPVKAFPEEHINGTAYLKNGANDVCNNTGLGPNGWSVIAHPAGGLKDWYNWKMFPRNVSEWSQDWSFHRSPSVIRSYGDSPTQNNGMGFMGMEIISNGRVQKDAWDHYLHYDRDITINEWNNAGLNKFVVGVGNSDCHQEWITKPKFEDLTGLKKGHLGGYCLVDNVEERAVKHFEDKPYWKAAFKNAMFGRGCTFVYCDQVPLESKILLEALRSCGKSTGVMGGVTASDIGSFATFTANNVPSGGLVDLGNTNLVLKLWAYPFLKGLGTKLSYKVIGDGGSSPTPRVLRTESTIQVTEYTGHDITILNNEINNYDWIRVEFEFEFFRDLDSKNRWRIKWNDTAICNPVFIKKSYQSNEP